MGGDQDQNFKNIRGKVNNQVLFWVRFNLSLPGRICIAKSMMYSQINYLGCILLLTAMELQTLSIMIEDYVRGNLNISRKRLLQSCNEGGLGFFNLRDLLDAQQCAWVKRAQTLDNWKLNIYSRCYGSALNVRAEKIDSICYPILHGILVSYEHFLMRHTQWNENFKLSFVFENPALTLNLRTPDLADAYFFGDLMEHNEAAILKLKVSDIF